jgi:hypothetical protein
LFFRAPDLSANDQSKPCTGGAVFFVGNTSEDLTGGGEAGFAAA